MIQRVRSRLVGLALLVSVAAGLAAAAVMRPQTTAEVWPIAAAAFAIAIAAGWTVAVFVRSATRRLVRAMHDVIRDPSRRIPTEGPPGDELRELTEWINFLAEDADRSHRALARERMLLAAVADGLTQGVIAVDSEHRIELLNDAARKMLGVQSSLVGEPLLEFVRVPELHQLVEGSEDASAEVQLPNGPRTIVRAARTWGRAGRVLLLEDVTNVRKLETVRRDFVANVSHELRTPVAVIRANAETLMAGAQNDPQMAPKLIEGLHRNAERLARILADLLDLSRLDAGQYRLDITPVGVRAVTDQSLSAVETQAKARNVTLDIAVPTQLQVRADAKEIGRASCRERV